ncbi:MAG: serine dehydratase, partial [Acidimicrobiales bacterium]|nr:serine dehydratase [Acidimicrobiales bacterium]
MARTLPPSIFNDVVGPIMRGPSSSHSAASVRIGLLIHDLCGGTPDVVELDYDTQGSLATTHESQGTDMGLYGGLLGWPADDARLATSPTVIRDSGTTIEVRKSTLNDPHPNTYRIHVRRGEEAHNLIALSTGGGMIEVIEIDGFAVQLFGDYATTLLHVEGDASAIVDALNERDDVDAVVVSGANPSLVVVSGQKWVDDETIEDLRSHGSVGTVRRLRAVLPVLSRQDMSVPFSDSGELESSPLLATAPLSDWAIAYETERGGVTEDEVLRQAGHILEIMRRGVETGLAGTEYEDRILGWQSGRFAELAEQKSLLDGGLLNTMITYVTALMEAKSAM